MGIAYLPANLRPYLSEIINVGGVLSVPEGEDRSPNVFSPTLTEVLYNKKPDDDPHEDWQEAQLQIDEASLAGGEDAYVADMFDEVKYG
jgi:hypothetical protein